MRYLVISDLHASIVALDAVLEDSGPVDLVLALGDYVGFGLHPNEVVSRLRGLPNMAIIKGNWYPGFQKDYARAGNPPRPSNPKSKRIVSMGLSRVSPENEAYLKSLPERTRLNLEEVPVLMVHGSVLDSMWGYLTQELDPELLESNARASYARMVVHGDTHLQGSFDVDGVTFVNPGSTGWPSDGDPRAAYCIIDCERGSFEVDLRRISYDVELVHRELVDAGLPNADNILSGRSIWED